MDVLLNEDMYALDAPDKVAAYTGDINATGIMRSYSAHIPITPLMAAVHARREDVIAALHARGDVNPNRLTTFDMTALHIAVCDAIDGVHKPQSMITALITHFPGVDLYAPTGWSDNTPLGMCVQGAKCARLRRHAVQELLAAGADPRKPCNSSGRSAVDEATIYTNLAMMQLFTAHMRTLG